MHSILFPHIGTAAWAIPKQCADLFPGNGSHLQRYAAVLNAVALTNEFALKSDPFVTASSLSAAS